MGLKETFRKQGGVKLIKQYMQAGVLGTAIGEFLLLGKSRTALEILRLSTQLKTKQKLYKKYHHVLDVKKCYESVKNNLSDMDIILITSENMDQYVQFPEYIIEKWKSGIITNTHLTDLLRLESLIRYGGMWLDATVFCSEQESSIPDYFFNSDLFFYQSLKPGRDGKSTYISSWLMSAKTNNKVLMATRELCYEYWKRENQMLDYFLLHDFFSIVLDRYTEEWNKVVPRDNATPHVLLLRLFDQYDEKIWKAIKKQTPFHKLSYKYKDEQRLKDDTFLKRIIGI